MNALREFERSTHALRGGVERFSDFIEKICLVICLVI